MIDKRIGILGGGQLGKMIYSAGSQMNIKLSYLDQSKDSPTGQVCMAFEVGDITAYDDVLSFGRKNDIISIEIEKVNVEALKQLQKEGKSVCPSPGIIEMIQDKGLQKEFYKSNDIANSPFILVEGEDEINNLIEKGQLTFPFVQKSRKGGYHGQGVAVINNESDLNKLLPVPSVIEDLVAIEKEIAVIVCRNRNGEVAIYDPVEMVFDPQANLLDYHLAPANLSNDSVKEVFELAMKMANTLSLEGILAIELFLDQNDQIIVNEMAPRPHNSGHHTIESCFTSQYENMLRAILNQSLGRPEILCPSILINLLGSAGYSGDTVYTGLEEILNVRGSNLHLYGKSQTKPFRKMGHVTLLHDKNYVPLESKDLIKSVFKTKPVN